MKITHKNKIYEYDTQTIMVSGDAYRKIKKHSKENDMKMKSVVDKMVEMYFENN